MILSRVLLPPFITILLVFGTMVAYFAAGLRRQVQDKLTTIVEDHRRIIDQFLFERASDLEFAANTNSLSSMDQEGLLRLLAGLQAQSRAFQDLGVFDAAGNHVAYVGPYDLAGKNYADKPWFKAVQEERIYISDVFLGYRKVPHFIIAVKREENGAAWYLRSTIDTVYFNDLVKSIRVGKTGEAYLENRQGVFQTAPRSGGALMEIDPDRLPYPEVPAVTTFAARDSAGDRRLYAIGPLRQTDWLLVVRQEARDAYAPLYSAMLAAAGMIIAGGAAVVVLAYVLASNLTNRLAMADLEKKQMSAQLIMAGKLAEIGEMSAGVAHEINNPLQVMKAETALIIDLLQTHQTIETSPSKESVSLIKDSVDQIGVQIERCKNIVSGLLKFSRRSETVLSPIVVREFVAEIVALVKERAEMQKVTIRQEFAPNLPPLLSDPGQMQQVLLNLLNNALYALKGKKDGEIRVRGDLSGEFLSLTISDNGCGIPAENAQKIFMPFFTTKPAGQGTGLGLSTCYGIVDQLGGQITVKSEPNTGSEFTIRLPFSGPPARMRV
jgi:two-component system NtrC family sensor kinase